jgi:hypothetical protein
MRALAPALLIASLLVQTTVAALGEGKIFRCVEQGTVTFRDTPCADSRSSEEVTLPPVNSFAATKSTGASAARTDKPASVRSDNEASIAEEQKRARQQCERLSEQIAAIETKLRAGYTAKQGEQLRERLRELERRKRSERCR